MPSKAKPFRLREKPKASRVLGKQNYGRAWAKFRAYFATVVAPVCGDALSGRALKFSCGKSFPSRQMHLDHDPALTGPEDPGLLDESRVRWRCLWCHSAKTEHERGGIG